MSTYRDYIYWRTRGKPSSERDSDNYRINVTIAEGYKSVEEQLDLLWHDIDAGKFGDTAKTSEWYKDVKTVKDRFTKSDYPKE